MQTRQEKQVDTEGEPVDQNEAQKRRCDNGIEPERQDLNPRDTDPVKAAGHSPIRRATRPARGHDVMGGYPECEQLTNSWRRTTAGVMKDSVRQHCSQLSLSG